MQPITINHGIQSTISRNMLEKGPFLLIRLHQVKACAGRDDRHRDGGKASSASKIKHFSRWLQEFSCRKSLMNMLIKVRSCFRADQVDPLTPFEKEALIQLEPRLAGHL